MSGEYQRGYNAGYAAGQSSASVIIKQGRAGGYGASYDALEQVAVNTATVSKSSINLHFGCWAFYDATTSSSGPSLATSSFDAVVTSSSPLAKTWNARKTAILRAILSGTTLKIYWEPQESMSSYAFFYDVVIY